MTWKTESQDRLSPFSTSAASPGSRACCFTTRSMARERPGGAV